MRNLNLQNRVEINAIDDAFSGVRVLKDELISDEIYRIIKDSEVKKFKSEIDATDLIVLLRSRFKQWRETTTVGFTSIRYVDFNSKVVMTTDLTEISGLLEELPMCEDVENRPGKVS